MLNKKVCENVINPKVTYNLESTLISNFEFHEQGADYFSF